MRGPTLASNFFSETICRIRAYSHARTHARTHTRTHARSLAHARGHISVKVALALGKLYLLRGEVAYVEAVPSGEEVTSCDRGLIKGDYCT